MAKILWLTSQAKTHRQIIISIDSGKSKYFPASKKKNPESEKKGKLKKKNTQHILSSDNQTELPHK